MQKSITPNPDFGSADEVRTIMKHCRNGAERTRFQGIWYRMTGQSVAQTCQRLQIHRSTLQAWVRRWNAGGPDSLRSRPKAGRPRKLDLEARDVVVQEIEGRLADGTPYTALLIHGYLKKKTRPERGILHPLPQPQGVGVSSEAAPSQSPSGRSCRASRLCQGRSALVAR